MKKISLISLLLCLCLLVGSTVAPAALADEATPPETTESNIINLVPNLTFDGTDASITHGCRTLDAQYPLHGNAPFLKYSASALLYEVNSGTMLYFYNPDEPMSPSSLVKIMTAMLAIESGKMEDVVTVTKSALDSVTSNAVNSRLKPGEQMSLRNLVYCMLVGSANDASAVIAEYLAGSQQAFVDMMNRRARELGCTSTVYTNPHGLHDPAQVTTARDMARILLVAMELPDYIEICGTSDYTVPATNLSDPRQLKTVNKMLDKEHFYTYYDRRMTSGRTGTTNADKRCMAATAEGQDFRYIAVILGATPIYREDDPQSIRKHGNFEDTYSLLNLGFQKHSSSQVLYKGQIEEQYSVQGGANDIVVGPDEDLRCIFPGEADADSLVIRTQMTKVPLAAPIQKGDRVAVMQVWYGDVCIAQTDLLARNSSHVGLNPDGQGVNDGAGFDAGALSTAMTVLIVIGVVIVTLCVGLFVIRRARKSARNKRRRRRRE
jgi:D-alanyl-D-alanine carboxypeptidase (penicillin-binding protein 5/6)